MTMSARDALTGLLIVALGVTGAAQVAPPAKPSARQRRTWDIREFTYVKLVPREAGAPDNDHPVKIAPDVLRGQLSGIALASGATLFVKDDLDDLVKPLCQALSVAGPGDDLLLVSNRVREGSFLGGPTAVTARLFHLDGKLNVIVHDARFEFYSRYLGSKMPPDFRFGSRTQPGTAQLQCPGATLVRADWLAIPIQPGVPAPAGPALQLSAAVLAPAAAADTPKARDKSYYEQQEQRLRTLKRMRGEDLITEEEYQEKRKEVLANL